VLTQCLLGGHVPTYEYACTECGDRLEVVQRFSDDPLTVCAACGGRLRKVFSPVGIVFKGSGFYRTDSRSSTATAGANGNGKAGADGAESKSETPAKTESGAKAESKNAGSSDSGTGKSETAPASKGKSGTGSKVA
jgi:putative FmdB family regulatory protein